ncbi:MAG: SagB/ThcOx family dehydrogenase [Acidobacteriota bacterium]|nr:SagB/ThcOx family dehydrogenase [Acidobacteriota bacterium]
MTWREYHEATKHTAEGLRRAQHSLDWANMPDPFRHYEGVPVLDLPSDPPVLETPMLDVLRGVPRTTLDQTSVPAGPTFLSQLLFYSAAISASKRVASTGNRYALRVNPSSGNLHPTEFHFISRGLQDWPDGLYHYRPSAHMAEQRAAGDLGMPFGNSSAPLVFLLTSIAWREAWKYHDRAYRYCLHDIGHAWQAVALAAEAMGCDVAAVGNFPDDDVAQLCRLNQDEWPMLVIEVSGGGIPVRQIEAQRPVWFGGRANQLSKETTAYPWIDRIHEATKNSSAISMITRTSAFQPPGTGCGEITLPSPGTSQRGFGDVTRLRRSALDFMGGMRSISLPQLSAILAVSTHRLVADFCSASFIQLYLYAHRVDGLASGVYRVWPKFTEREETTLQEIKSGDQRVVAAGLSLGQDLAGNACVTFSMIGDLERATRAHGERGYRYVHFEAGAIGQRLYLAAESFGMGATGIGAFYDEEVHRYLNILPEQGQVVYHFAVGYPVPDPRLEA